MKKFEFSAESVLSVRSHQEDEALRVLADAQRTADHHDRALHATDREIRQTLDLPASADQILIDLYLQRLNVRRAQQQWEQQQSEAHLDRARASAQQAQADRKAVERLKEKHRERWKAEALHTAEQELGEQGITMMLRKRAAVT